MNWVPCVFLCIEDGSFFTRSCCFLKLLSRDMPFMWLWFLIFMYMLEEFYENRRLQRLKNKSLLIKIFSCLMPRLCCFLSSLGQNSKVKNSNISRECIRHLFSKMEMFHLWPAIHEKEFLAHIEEILESQVNPKFKEQSNNFCSCIFIHARTKTLREGVKVTGNDEFPFSKLYFCVACYVLTIYNMFSLVVLFHM